MPHSTTPPAYDSTPSSSTPSSSASSPAFNAFALPDVDPLPSYSRNYGPGEFSFPSPTDYIYTTKNTSLNLGKRINSTTIPSYGKNGLIQGMLTVTNFEHVKEISVTISGDASITVTDEGLGAIAHREHRTVLHHKIVLWSYSSRISPPITTQHFPVSYALPTLSALRDGSALPPSRAASSQTVALEVKYSVKVDVVRFGLYWHESTTVPFLYLPRTVPRPPEYFPMYKDDPKDVLEWGTYVAHPSGGPHDNDTTVKLHLPLPLSYPSGLPIPFRASLASSASRALSSHLVQTRLSVQLVKLIYVHVGSTKIPLDRILQTGHKWRVIDVGSKHGEWEISGSIDGVRPGSETAWTLNRFIEVKYAVRLVLAPIQGVSSGFVCEVPVELVTDQAEDLLRDKDAREYPALGLIQQQQHLSMD